MIILGIKHLNSTSGTKSNAGNLLLSDMLRNFAGIDKSTIIKGNYGKPHLSNGEATFNISHSGELVICALTCKYINGQKEITNRCHITLSGDTEYYVMPLYSDSSEVGADIEQISDKYEVRRLLKIAERYFTEDEQALIRITESMPHEFYRIWTVKECYLKYIGTGLSGISSATSEVMAGLNITSFTVSHCEHEYAVSVCGTINTNIQ